MPGYGSAAQIFQPIDTDPRRAESDLIGAARAIWEAGLPPRSHQTARYPAELSPGRACR